MGRTAAFRALWRALASRGGPGLLARLGAVPRMTWATLRGRYDGGSRVLLMLLGTLYVVSPLDAMPELLLPLVGLVDDLFVVTWIAGAFVAETDRFLSWEAAQRQGSAAGAPGPARPTRPADVIEGEVV